MDTQNLTPASVKAIENGGTNNAVIGRALVKRGVMVEQADVSRSIIPFKFVLSAEYAAADEAKYADAIEAEENEQDNGAHEAWQIEQWNAEDRERTIEALRTEFEDADDERREEIRNELARMGTVVYPEGSPQHAEYMTKLRTALADPNAFAFLGDVPAAEAKLEETIVQTDAEVRLAEAIDADDTEAIREILPAVDVIVRDPNEKRYAFVGSWTDENLFIKEEILSRRLNRKTLLRGDRMQAERNLRSVKAEIEKRGL